MPKIVDQINDYYSQTLKIQKHILIMDDEGSRVIRCDLIVTIALL